MQETTNGTDGVTTGAIGDTERNDAVATRCVMVLHDIDTSIGTMMDANRENGRFTRWVQGGRVSKRIRANAPEATDAKPIDGCYAWELTNGSMSIDAGMPLPDAMVDADGTWHDRDGLDDAEWSAMLDGAISDLAASQTGRVTFVGVK